MKSSVSSYVNEIDGSADRLLRFDDVSGIASLLFDDNLRELKSLVAYEKLSLNMLENCVIVTQGRVDVIQSAESDVNIILTKKCIPENPSIDVNRIYLTHVNILALQQSFDQLKLEVGIGAKKEDYIIHFAGLKRPHLNNVKKAVIEQMNNVYKETSAIKATEEHKRILQEKQIRV